MGAAGFLLGEFGPSVGLAGLIVCSLGNLGGAFIAICLLLFGIFMFRYLMYKISSDPIPAAQRRRIVAKEIGIIALNVLIYGGSCIIALGALTAMGYAPFVSLGIIALCITAFVLYRRYRKNHPVEYRYTSQAAIVLFLLVLGLVILPASLISMSETSIDLIRGPQTAVVTLQDFEEDRPTGRYSGLQSTKLMLKFQGSGGKIIPITVKEQDIESLRPIVESRGFMKLTYYPLTHIMVDISKDITS